MLNKNITQDRDKWIGGSDLPKIMTNANLYKVALEKLNPSFEGNEYTYYGQFMEPIIREYINYQYDYDFKPDTIYDGIYRANCDGIDDRAGKLLEIKTCGSELDLQYYMPQIQAYLNLFNIKTCLVVAYYRPNNFFTWGDITNRQSYNLDFDESRLETYQITKNKDLWRKIDAKARKFANALHLLEKTLFNEIDFNRLFYGNQIINLLEHYHDYKKLEKLIVEQGIYRAQIGDMYIKRTDISEFGVDVERLSREMPDVFEEYKTIKTTKKIEIRRRKNATKE